MCVGHSYSLGKTLNDLRGLIFNALRMLLSRNITLSRRRVGNSYNLTIHRRAISNRLIIHQNVCSTEVALFFSRVDEVYTREIPSREDIAVNRTSDWHDNCQTDNESGGSADGVWQGKNHIGESSSRSPLFPNITSLGVDQATYRLGGTSGRAGQLLFKFARRRGTTRNYTDQREELEMDDRQCRSVLFKTFLLALGIFSFSREFEATPLKTDTGTPIENITPFPGFTQGGLTFPPGEAFEDGTKVVQYAGPVMQPDAATKAAIIAADRAAMLLSRLLVIGIRLPVTIVMV